MYVNPNFKTKKALKAAVANNDKITILQPGPFGGNEQKDGITAVEGPHYPEPHRWYAEVILANGHVIKVK